jgi:hypothetical protein
MTAREPLPVVKRTAALERRCRAKELVTKASRALVDRLPLAAALADAAMAELREADAELALLDGNDQDSTSQEQTR